MVAPIDYRTQVASPFEAAVQGLNLGAGIAGMREKRQQQELAAQRQQEKSRLLSEFMAIENPKAEDFARATVAIPEMADQFKQSFEMHEEGAKKTFLSEMGSVYSALSSGNPNVAIDILNARADATENAGLSRDQINTARDLARAIEINPDVIRNQLGLQLASLPGGKEMIEGAEKLSQTRMKEGLFPSEIKQAAADIGKTEAETKKLLAEVDKLGIEGQKAVLELERLGKGIADPEKQFDQEEKLRKEYAKRTDAYTESKRTYDNLKSSAAAGAAGDIALVTSFMKMLDPGSVVRETEFATARDTTGLLTRLQNMAKKIDSGEFLSEPQRKSFVNLAGKYMAAAEKEEKGVREDLDKVVKNYSLNPDNVFGTRAEESQPAAPQKVITVDY